MKIIYSFWSEPIKHDNEKLSKIRWLYALSVSSVKRYSSCKVVLHTDTDGKDILGDLPFDEIKTTLDDVQIDKHFWASSKIIALSMEDAPVIHIDGDVSFKSKKVLDIIIQSDYDIIVQSLETDQTWDNAYEPYIYEVKNNCPFDFDYGIKEAYNCGIVGFKNTDVKSAFIVNFNKMIDALQEAKNKTELMVLIEQWNLRQIAEKHKSNTMFLLSDTPDWSEMSRIATDIGYVHLLGGIKWQKNIQEKVKERTLDNLLALLK